MKIVSACLAGIPCRWDGKAKPCEQIIQLVKDQEAIPLCPEELWWLSTPREQAEIQQNGRVKTINGDDITEKYLTGAQKVLELVKNSYDVAKLFSNQNHLHAVVEKYLMERFQIRW